MSASTSSTSETSPFKRGLAIMNKATPEKYLFTGTVLTKVYSPNWYECMCMYGNGVLLAHFRRSLASALEKIKNDAQDIEGLRHGLNSLMSFLQTITLIDDDVGVSAMDDSISGSEDKAAMAKMLSIHVSILSKNLSKMIQSNCVSNSQQQNMIGMCEKLHKDGLHLHDLILRVEKEVHDLEQLKAEVKS